MHMREKGKRPLLLKRTPSGRESRASCQGTTFHFPDMRLRQERGGRGGEVRASAGPPGTPLPGGGKSMWFLSYLWEGWSTASNTDIQCAAKSKKRANTKDENALTPLPTAHLIYSSSLCRWTWVCVCMYAGEHTLPTFHSSQGWGDRCGLINSQSVKRCQIKKTLFHPGL